MTRLRRLAALTSDDAALLARAFLLVLRIRVALQTLSWPLFVRVATRSRLARRSSSSAARIEWAVRAASGLVPRATCLTQAIALRRLLAMHGHAASIHIGVAGEDGRLAAHAWVECAGRRLLCSDAQVARYSALLSWPDAKGIPVR
jgi:hypothetical protein